MSKGRIKRIHVNQHMIRSNRTKGENEPVVTVQMSDRVVRGHRVTFGGRGQVVYSPKKPLRCGATVWVETRGPVTIERDTKNGRVRREKIA